MALLPAWKICKIAGAPPLLLQLLTFKAVNETVVIRGKFMSKPNAAWRHRCILLLLNQHFVSDVYKIRVLAQRWFHQD